MKAEEISYLTEKGRLQKVDVKCVTGRGERKENTVIDNGKRKENKQKKDERTGYIYYAASRPRQRIDVRYNVG